MTPTEMEVRVCEAMKRCAINDASYEALARAAIRAMREPTPEMIEAADLKSGVFCNGLYVSRASDYETPHKFIWTAMIDAASPPQEPKP
jgi:hypothetical protein